MVPPRHHPWVGPSTPTAPTFYIPDGGSIPIPLQGRPQLEQPFAHAASFSSDRAVPKASTMPTHVMAPPPLFYAQSWYISPIPTHAAIPLPAFTTIPQRFPQNLPEQPSFSHSIPPPPPTSRQPESTPIDLSEKIPPPPRQRPVIQPYPFHISIMNGSVIFSKESQRTIDQFSAEIDGRDLSCRFQGLVNPDTKTSLNMTNDPGIFAHRFWSGFADLPSWALPLDEQSGSRTQPSMPLRDERTPVRVAVLLRLLPDQCLIRKAHKPQPLVIVPTSDNREISRPAADPTATDLLRVFVHEFTELGQSVSIASAVRSQLLLLPGESWMPAAHRTLMHTRAAHVKYYKPHAMEETYYLRTVAGDQLEHHCGRVIGILNPSNANPFRPVLLNLCTSIREDLDEGALNKGQLL